MTRSGAITRETPAPTIRISSLHFQWSSVDIGVSLNAGASQPCSSTFSWEVLSIQFATLTDFFRHGRTRTNAPTEQLSLQSNYLPGWDISAKVATPAEAPTCLTGSRIERLESKSNTRGESITGPVFGERVATTADFGATWHLTSKLSFIDSFHYSNFHNPVEFDPSTCSLQPNLLTPRTSFRPGPPCHSVVRRRRAFAAASITPQIRPRFFIRPVSLFRNR